MNLTRLLTQKSALQHSRLETLPLAPIAEGEALLAIRHVALTTNNITYAAFGDAIQYWNFFPTGQAEWGYMPVWGFADVVSSTVDGIEVGQRFYGYFPIASHLRMQPVRVSERGFYDGTAHRQSLTSAYDQYTRCSADLVYRESDEALQMRELRRSGAAADRYAGALRRLLGQRSTARACSPSFRRRAGLRVLRRFGAEHKLPVRHRTAGPAPAFHFAPVQIKKPNADWGTAVVNERFGEAQQRFIRHVSDAGRLRVAEHTGFEAAQGLIADLHAGRADPLLGHVVTLRPEHSPLR